MLYNPSQSRREHLKAVVAYEKIDFSFLKSIVANAVAEIKKEPRFAALKKEDLWYHPAVFEKTLSNVAEKMGLELYDQTTIFLTREASHDVYHGIVKSWD